MLLAVVCILAGVIFSEGGSIRENMALGIPHPLSINREILEAQLLPRGIRYAVQDVPEKGVSNSLSHEDYLYLKRHKVGHQGSSFNPDPFELDLTIADIKGKHKREHVFRSETVLKRKAGTNSVKTSNKTLFSAPVPIVYFHVPSSAFNTAAHLIQPAQENINNLIINVPFYEPSQSYLQGMLQNQQNQFDDQILNYVLSKAVNLPQPVVQPTNPSSPEVYFIKYKTAI